MRHVEVDFISLELQFTQAESLASKPVTMLYFVCLAVQVESVEKGLWYWQLGEYADSTSYWSAVYRIKDNEGKQKEQSVPL